MKNTSETNSTFNKIWSQAFLDFTREPQEVPPDDPNAGININIYRYLYKKYQGVGAEPPKSTDWVDNSQNPNAAAMPPEQLGDKYPHEWVAWEHIPATSPLKTGVLKIGTYAHEPYYYREDGTLKGFEYELAQKLIAMINRYYRGLAPKEIVVEWKEVEIKEEDLPMDGSDNTIISGRLSDGLANGEYDMVMSGILVTNMQEGKIFAFPNTNFYISALYTGKDNFTEPPTSGDLHAIALWLADNCPGTRDKTIYITNTNDYAGNDCDTPPGCRLTQQKSADKIVAAVNFAGGVAYSHPRLIPSILNAINDGEVHLYVGDLIQIQRLAMDDSSRKVLFDGPAISASLLVAPYMKVGL